MTSANECKLFSGTSNPSLAHAIAKQVKLPLAPVEIKRFADGEISVLVQESVRGADVFVVQSTSAPVNDHIMELVLLVDALKRASAGRITAVVPYYGYCRQDRLIGRSPISAKLVAELITASGVDSIVSVDLHARPIEGFFNIPVDNLTAISLFAHHFKTVGGTDPDARVVVSPDVGGVKRARDLSRLLGCGLAIIDKQRPKANSSEVANVIGDVEGKTAIIVDDLVDTGGSMVNAAQALAERGATSVYAAATHGVLSPPAYERIADSVLKEMVVTDSIALRAGAPSKIRTISIAPLLADTIRRLHAHQSVSSLYKV